MTPRQSTVLLSLLLAALAGCGPGTGGTGTGVSAGHLATFGATAASVCAAPFADQLRCLPTATQPGFDIGTQAVHYVDKASGGMLSVTLTDNTVDLLAPCSRLSFSGTWGVALTGEMRFFGQYQLGPDGAALPASARIEPVASATGDTVTITLFAADGQVLHGPVQIHRVSTPPPGVSCP